VKKKGIAGFLAMAVMSGAQACAPASNRSAGPPAETILVNGKILTVDANFSTVQALAISQGRIQAAGTNEEIQRLAGAETRTIDLQGKTVVPGLVDNHFHSAGGGPGVDLSRVRTMEELLQAIEARIRQSKPGDLITTNSDWHEAQIKEQRLPLRRDLDGISPDNPVVVVRGGHEYILNSAALKKWNITTATPVPSGGRISRYDDGALNGELVDTAKALAPVPRELLGSVFQTSSDEDLEARIARKAEEYGKLVAVGLTTVRHPGAPIGQYRLLREMKARERLPLRVNFVVSVGDAKSPEDIAKAVDSWQVDPDEGDEWLRIGGVKLVTDGGFEGGWMRRPYAEPWGKGGTFFGLPRMSEEVFTGMVKELARRNWRVATHAVGDAAIDLVLKGYEAADAEHPIAARRWTIEHGFIAQPDQFERIKKLGLVVSAQDHLYVAGPSLKQYWGEERANLVTPVRTYLDNNIMVSLGTDSPVIPYPPLWVLYHFITRDTISGGVFGKEQRISREEALRAITQNNAYLTFEEKVKGSLEPGKLADLVVLSADYMTCPETEIRDMSVLLTMVNGQVVYRRPGSGF